MFHHHLSRKLQVPVRDWLHLLRHWLPPPTLPRYRPHAASLVLLCHSSRWFQPPLPLLHNSQLCDRRQSDSYRGWHHRSSPFPTTSAAYFEKRTRQQILIDLILLGVVCGNVGLRRRRGQSLLSWFGVDELRSILYELMSSVPGVPQKEKETFSIVILSIHYACKILNKHQWSIHNWFYLL